MSENQGRAARRKEGKTREPRDARDIAFAVMTGVAERDAYANLLLPKAIDEARLGARDKAFATDLVYGTLRWRRLIDAIIEAAARRPATAIDSPVLTILRLGTYQTLWMDVPAHAAVSTSVTLARRHAKAGAAGLVNAVLRRVSERSLQEWQSLVVSRIPASQPVTRLGVRWSHPDWIVEALGRSWDEAGYEGDSAAALGAILEADNTPPQVTLVARPGLIGRDTLAESLPKGASVERGRWSPYALRVRGVAPDGVDAVRRRLAGVEDEGSQLAALALACAPLDGAAGPVALPDATGNVVETHSDADFRWLDLCAGPGGKTALLSALAALRGAKVTANEPSHHRAQLVRDNISALPPGVVEDVIEKDGRTLGDIGMFDRVLVDAPCSGLGSLRRRPEARWRKTPRDAADLASLQAGLLESAFRCARVGGVIAYVTCTPLLSETRRVVDAFLEGHAAERLDTAGVLRSISPGIPLPAAGGDVQLFSHLHDTDQMFIALIRRTA